MTSSRDKERQNLRALVRAAQAYEIAHHCGASCDSFEYRELLRAIYSVTEVDGVHDLLTDLTPPEHDFFGNPVASLRARVASIQFDMGKSA